MTLRMIAMFCSIFAGIGVSFADDRACARVHAVADNLNATKRFQLSMLDMKDGREWGVRTTIILETKTYSRWQNGPWSAGAREHFSLAIDGVPIVSDCRVVGEESLDGFATTVILYKRYRPDIKMYVRMWVGNATSLPVKAHLQEFESEKSLKTIVTYFYDPNVSEPVSETIR